ncbi:unnamed protein product [Musa acuminata subsp. burmannicoides]
MEEDREHWISPPMEGRRGFTGRCGSLVKEQRARIHILRRCATMLLCWYIHGDDGTA